jgi:hypothetical protein
MPRDLNPSRRIVNPAQFSQATIVEEVIALA